MSDKEKNYSVLHTNAFSDLSEKESYGVKGKLFISQELGLTGCEMSVNSLPAGTSVPFVHVHNMNEELYIIVNGKGVFYVDGEEFPVQAGSLIRVAPAGKRAIKAGDEDLFYLCVQARNNSLEQFAIHDGRAVQAKASWM